MNLNSATLLSSHFISHEIFPKEIHLSPSSLLVSCPHLNTSTLHMMANHSVLQTDFLYVWLFCPLYFLCTKIIIIFRSLCRWHFLWEDFSKVFFWVKNVFMCIQSTLHVLLESYHLAWAVSPLDSWKKRTRRSCVPSHQEHPSAFSVSGNWVHEWTQ